MRFSRKYMFSAFLTSLSLGGAVRAAEFEVLDRFSVDGYSVLRGSADIPGGSFTVGGSTFVVQYGGIGIGTTNPGGRLEIVGSGSIVPLIVSTGAAAGSEVMRVNSGGKVGIGTSAPGAKLDVSGGVKLANDDGECNQAKAGTIRFTGTNFQGCTGAAWLTLENSPPSVVSVNPDNGAMAGLYAITITGAGFGSPAVVTIGGNPAANVTTVSGTQITATVPASSSSGAKDVVVRNPDGLLSTFTGGFRYNPGVTNVSPGNGPVNAGTNITITGAGFVSGAAITINNVSAANVAWTSASQLTATTPADTVSGGAKDVKVTNPDAGYGVLTSGYRYDPVITSVSPGNGPINAGTVLTIAGKGFITGATVKINEVSAAGAAVNSDIQMTATTPANTTSGGAKAVKVSNPDAGYGVLTGGYRYDPAVTNVYPTAAATRGNYPITLTGAGFISGPSVTVGGVTAAVTAVTDIQITADIPSNQLSSGVKNIIVTNAAGGAGTLTGGFTAQPSGESQANAGLNCKGILNTAGGSAGDGTYWINPAGGGASQAYCDMAYDGGGWTKVISYYDNTNVAGAGAVNANGAWTTAKKGLAAGKLSTADITALTTANAFLFRVQGGTDNLLNYGAGTGKLAYSGALTEWGTDLDPAANYTLYGDKTSDGVYDYSVTYSNDSQTRCTVAHGYSGIYWISDHNYNFSSATVPAGISVPICWSFGPATATTNLHWMSLIDNAQSVGNTVWGNAASSFMIYVK